MNSKTKFSIAIILVAIAGLAVAFHKPAYVPQTDVLTFQRNLSADEGSRLDPASLVSKEGVRLTDVFSPTTKTFTPERKSRYGADRTQPGGVGLTVKFVQTQKGKADETKTFALPGWPKFEDTTRPTRRKTVEGAELLFADAIAVFTAPVKLDLTFAEVLDTTEGVDANLAHRAQSLIDETGAVRLNKMGHNVTMNLYHITEQSYQGSRRVVDLSDKSDVNDAKKWFTTPQPAEKNSSVLRGLKSILEDLAGKHPQVDIITNGLENLQELSVYKDPSLLEPTNWSKLDQFVDLSKLDLKGMEIHLHPLPVSKTSPENLMKKALDYLASRLSQAGAKTTIEPL